MLTHISRFPYDLFSSAIRVCVNSTLGEIQIYVCSDVACTRFNSTQNLIFSPIRFWEYLYTLLRFLPLEDWTRVVWIWYWWSHWTLDADSFWIWFWITSRTLLNKIVIAVGGAIIHSTTTLQHCSPFLQLHEILTNLFVTGGRFDFEPVSSCLGMASSSRFLWRGVVVSIKASKVLTWCLNSLGGSFVILWFRIKSAAFARNVDWFTLFLPTMTLKCSTTAAHFEGHQILPWHDRACRAYRAGPWYAHKRLLIIYA